MKETEKYLRKILSTDVDIKPLATDQQTNFPLFIRHSYNFFQAQLFGRKIILLEKKDKETLTADQLRKHAQMVEKALECPVVFVLPYLETYNRKRLIQKQVAFIVPDKQMFIPQIFIDLRELRQTAPDKKEKLLPAAQCILLYHLLRENIESFPLKILAKKLGYTQATVTRAVQALENKSIVSKIVKNKEVRIFFTHKKKRLWETALPFLQSPVKKVYYLERSPHADFVYRASFSALSHYTDLAEGDKAYFAVSQQDFKTLKKKQIQIVPSSEAEVHLEIWKYTPGVLAEDRVVDPLSLYLSLNDQQDERVQKALDILLERVW